MPHALQETITLSPDQSEAAAALSAVSNEIDAMPRAIRRAAYPTAGTYALGVRAASVGLGGTFHLEMNGVNVTGTMTVPNTGGWQNWQTLTTTVTLAAIFGTRARSRRTNVAGPCLPAAARQRRRHRRRPD